MPHSSRSVTELIAAVDAGKRPRCVHFWGHTPRREGVVDKASFSQWYPARFDADGEVFATAEHYMMWRKAMLFGDDAVARAVLVADSPGAAKTLGREVSGFDEETWVAERWEIVVRGSVAKFSSDPTLRDFLLATRGRVLVEASPRDRIWGIGMGSDNPAAEDPNTWRGLNLLGFALMEARDRIALA